MKRQSPPITSSRRVAILASIRAGLLAAVATVIASCAVGPNFHKPAAPANAGFAPTPLPDTTASTSLHGGEAQHLVAGGDIPFQWWELFQCPALNSLIEKAFRANPTIAAAQAALTQAHEMVSAQQGFFYPSVGATYQAERHKIAGNLTNDQAPGVQGNGDNLSRRCKPRVCRLTRHLSFTVFRPLNSPWDSFPTCSAATGAR